MKREEQHKGINLKHMAIRKKKQSKPYMKSTQKAKSQKKFSSEKHDRLDKGCMVLDDIPAHLHNHALITLASNLKHRVTKESRIQWSVDMVDKTIEGFIKEGNRARWMYNKNNGMGKIGKGIGDIVGWWDRWFTNNCKVACNHGSSDTLQ